MVAQKGHICFPLPISTFSLPASNLVFFSFPIEFLITNFQFGYFSFLFASIVYYHRHQLCACANVLWSTFVRHVGYMLVSCPVPFVHEMKGVGHETSYMHVASLSSYTSGRPFSSTDYFRGPFQTKIGKINVIMTLRGKGLTVRACKVWQQPDLWNHTLL